MTPEHHPLDTTALQTAYAAQELPSHERFGKGERYTFGTTLADVYPNPPDLSPLMHIRMVKGVLAVGDVLHIVPTETGGVHVDHSNGACEISKTGDVAAIYTAPQPPTSQQTKEVIAGTIQRDREGNEYLQTSFDIPGTAEGTRVRIRGVVAASPQASGKAKNSPLVFFLGEDDPEKAGEKVWHEVYARNKGREMLKQAHLKKGDVIEAVMYRHTWEIELGNGEKRTHKRHNLATITKVERTDDAKRLTGKGEK
jgi:hypothetical protein